jgi:hypothetical protein
MTVHDQARQLIALGDELSAAQQPWLRAHLDECQPCRDYAEAASRVVRALGSSPLAADSALVRATQGRVHARALELRAQQQRTWLVGLSCLLVGLSSAATTPLLWQVFARMGAWAGLSRAIWEAGFAFFWMVPALVVSVLLAASGTHLAHDMNKPWK